MSWEIEREDPATGWEIESERPARRELPAGVRANESAGGGRGAGPQGPMGDEVPIAARALNQPAKGRRGTLSAARPFVAGGPASAEVQQAEAEIRAEADPFERQARAVKAPPAGFQPKRRPGTAASDPFEDRQQAIDAAVDDLALGADPQKVMAAYGRLGIKPEEIIARGRALNTGGIFADQRPQLPRTPEDQAAFTVTEDGRLRSPGEIRNLRREGGVVLGDVGDTAAAFGRGVAGGVKSIADALPRGNKLSEGAGQVADFFDSLRSQAAARDDDAIADILQNAPPGLINQLRAGVKAAGVAPAAAIAGSLGMSVPLILGGLLPGVRESRLAALAMRATTGAAQGVGDVRDSIYEAVKADLMQAGMTRQEAEDRAEAAQAYLGANGKQLALAAGLGAVASMGGVEGASIATIRRLLGKGAARETGEAAARETLENLARKGPSDKVGGTIVGAVKAGGAETLTEIPQEGQSAYAVNLARAREGAPIDPMQGVIAQAGMAGALAAVAGGGPGAIDGFTAARARDADLERRIVASGDIAAAVELAAARGELRTPADVPRDTRGTDTPARATGTGATPTPVTLTTADLPTRVLTPDEAVAVAQQAGPIAPPAPPVDDEQDKGRAAADAPAGEAGRAAGAPAAAAVPTPQRGDAPPLLTPEASLGIQNTPQGALAAVMQARLAARQAAVGGEETAPASAGQAAAPAAPPAAVAPGALGVPAGPSALTAPAVTATTPTASQAMPSPALPAGQAPVAVGGQAAAPAVPAVGQAAPADVRQVRAPTSEDAAPFSTADEARAYAAQAGLEGRVQVAGMRGGNGFVLAPLPRNATPEQQADAAAAVEVARTRLARSRDPADAAAAQALQVVPDARVAAPIRAVQSVVETVLGIRVVPVRGLRSTGAADGLAVPRADGSRVALVDVDTAKSAPALLIGTIGHEVTHVLRRDDPDGYNRLAAVVAQFARPGVREAAQLDPEAKAGPVSVGEETVSDIQGGLWLDPKFWSRVRDLDDGSTMRRVLYTFMETATKVARMLPGAGFSRFEVSRYVTNVQAVREVAASVMADRAAMRSRAPAAAQNAESGGAAPDAESQAPGRAADGGGAVTRTTAGTPSAPSPGARTIAPQPASEVGGSPAVPAPSGTPAAPAPAATTVPAAFAAAPSAEGRSRVDRRRARGKAQFRLDTERDSMLVALAKMGGVNRELIAREFGLAREEQKHTVRIGNLKAAPFRKTGGMGVDEAAQALAEAGYFPGVAPEDIVREFEERLFNELGGDPHFTPEGMAFQDAERERIDAELAELEAEAAAREIEQFDPDELEDAGYFDTNPAEREATQRILDEAQALGIDTAEITERVYEATRNEPDAVYQREVQRAARAAIEGVQSRAGGQAAGADPGRARGGPAGDVEPAGDQGAQGGEGDVDPDVRRSPAQADDRRLIEARKRASVLRSLLDCLAA